MLSVEVASAMYPLAVISATPEPLGLWCKQNLSPPLPPRLDSPHPSSMSTRAADRRYRLGCEPTDKPASIGRPGLSAKQPERMLLQVVKCRPAEQGNGNEFGRERRRAKDGRQCRLHVRAQAGAHYERNDQPREVTPGDQ